VAPKNVRGAMLHICHLRLVHDFCPDPHFFSRTQERNILPFDSYRFAPPFKKKEFYKEHQAMKGGVLDEIIVDMLSYMQLLTSIIFLLSFL
jgi:hypothetical protein